MESLLEQIHADVEIMQGTDNDSKFLATQRLRRILHYDNYETRQLFIDHGIVSKFIALLDDDNQSKKIQFEALWALTNVLSGNSTQTRLVVELGIIPQLIKFIRDHPDEDIKGQAIWALGNIVGDSVDCRDMVLELGALPVLFNIVARKDEFIKGDILMNIAWVFSNIFKRNPRPPESVMLASLPTLKSLLMEGIGHDTVKDTCWALSFIADGPIERIQAVIDAGVLPRLAAIMSSNQKYPQILRPAIRTIGSIAAGDELQTDHVIKSNILSTFLPLLDLKIEKLLKDLCWTISNITAGTDSQIQAVVDANLIPKLVELSFSENLLIRKEAIWSIANVKDVDSKRTLISQISSKKTIDPRIVPLIFESLTKIRSLDPLRNDSVYRRAIGYLIKSGIFPRKIDHLFSAYIDSLP